MRKIKIALSLIIVGLIIFVSVMALNNWNFKKLSNTEYITNTYEIAQDFENITINITTADIKILPSTDEKCKIEAYEETNYTHKIEVINQTLTVTPPNKKIFHSIFNFETPKITIYLPTKEYQSLNIDITTSDLLIDSALIFKSLNINNTTGDIESYAIIKENININSTTGDITIKNATCSGDILIDISTGEINLTDIKCKNLTAKGTTNITTLNNVVANEKFDLERTTGDITLNNCDANEIYINVTTGDVKGNILTGKTFDVHTTTGNKNIPATSGGICKIDTTTGDIIITVSQSE